MQKVVIGIITKAKGIRGEIKVLPLTDNYKRFKYLKEIEIVDSAGEQEKFEIEKATVTDKKVNLKLKGIETRNQALELKGKEIVINKDRTLPLDNGNYYIFQIVGLDAFDEKGEYLGKVSDVLKNPGNDIFLIKKEEKEYLIPAVKEIVINVDLENRKITINCIEGLFD